MGAKNGRKSKQNTKNILSKHELRVARRNSALLVTKEDEKLKILEEEQSHFARLAKDLKEAKKPENDPVEILMKEVSEEIKEPMENETKELTQEEKICKDYNDGLTIREIAKNYELSYQKVRSILIKKDVKIRPRGFKIQQPVENVEEPKVEVAEISSVEEDIEEVLVEPLIEENVDEEVNEEPSIHFFNFADQDFTYVKLRKLELSNVENSDDVFIAGLVKDRHDIPFVDKYIFETLTQANFNNPDYCENKARGFINAYLRPDKNSDKHKTLVVYCTGLQLALSALVSVCAQMQINLITMHLNTDLRKFMPQKTLCIFGDKIPDIGALSTNLLKPLKDKYDKIFTYGCDVDDLIEKGNCTYIKASFGEKFTNDSNSVLILFNKDFPDQEDWRIFGDLIKAMQREDLENKKHCVILGRIQISLNGFKFGDNVAKSFNYRNSVNQSK